MKILLVDVNYNHTSTGKIVRDLAHGLTGQGHDVEVFFGRGEAASEPGVAKIANSVEVLGHVLMSRITGLVGYFSPFATRKLIAEVKRFKPDVVHLHELHGYYLNIEEFVLFLKESGVKVVWTFHCEFMYTGRCGYANDCTKWMAECHRCPQLNEYPKSLIFDFSQRMHLAKKRLFEGFRGLVIATPSNWLADRVKHSFLNTHPIKVVYNGIDINIFKPTPYQHLIDKHSLHGRKVVLAVAPDLMSERKGGRWVVELAQRFVDHPVQFVMVGVKEQGLEYAKNITALPIISDQQELAAYYSLADFTLLPSSKETFSLVTVESLACGTPVFGFDSGAPVEVAPKGYGEFIPYGNIDGLVGLLSGYLAGQTPFFRPAQCAAFARLMYSKESMLEGYMALYSKPVL